MKTTPNYKLPTYEETDNPDLITGYNAAITAIDTQMKKNADTAAAHTQVTYKTLTVGELAKGLNIAYKN